MIKALVPTPDANEPAILNLLSNFKPMAIPKIVENSATPFIEEPRTSPLRASMPKKATADVKIPGIMPKSKKDKTIGIPVKSNFRKGSQGNGILRYEYLRV